jgi:hypothetical protein
MGARRLTTADKEASGLRYRNRCVRGRNSRPGRFLGNEEGMIYIKGENERALRPLLGAHTTLKEFLLDIFPAELNAG